MIATLTVKGKKIQVDDDGKVFVAGTEVKAPAPQITLMSIAAVLPLNRDDADQPDREYLGCSANAILLHNIYNHEMDALRAYMERVGDAATVSLSWEDEA